MRFKEAMIQRREEIFGDTPLNVVVQDLRKRIEHKIKYINEYIYFKRIATPIIFFILICVNLVYH